MPDFFPCPVGEMYVELRATSHLKSSTKVSQITRHYLALYSAQPRRHMTLTDALHPSHPWPDPSTPRSHPHQPTPQRQLTDSSCAHLQHQQRHFKTRCRSQLVRLWDTHRSTIHLRNIISLAHPPAPLECSNWLQKIRLPSLTFPAPPTTTGIKEVEESARVLGAAVDNVALGPQTTSQREMMSWVALQWLKAISMPGTVMSCDQVVDGSYGNTRPVVTVISITHILCFIITVFCID
ncbi:hypothetical protein BGW80DRAFT_309206 [Lactifluus volemus]|nr:hypothetical protein BGW80DRAFT_309206 [Lactifluus volemus]